MCGQRTQLRVDHVRERVGVLAARGHARCVDRIADCRILSRTREVLLCHEATESAAADVAAAAAAAVAADAATATAAASVAAAAAASVAAASASAAKDTRGERAAEQVERADGKRVRPRLRVARLLLARIAHEAGALCDEAATHEVCPPQRAVGSRHCVVVEGDAAAWSAWTRQAAAAAATAAAARIG